MSQWPKPRIPTQEQQRVLETPLPESTVTCRPGIRGRCGNRDCPNCYPRDEASEARRDPG